MSEVQILKIGEIFNIEKGTLQSTKSTKGEFHFITASSDWKTHNEYTHECEALIVAVGASGSLGRTHYVNDKFISSDLCFIVTPKDEFKDIINLEFYHIFFHYYIREDLVSKLAKGASKKAINQRDFKNYEVPLYPIDTQNRMKDKLKFSISLHEEVQKEIKLLSQENDNLINSFLNEAFTF